MKKRVPIKLWRVHRIGGSDRYGDELGLVKATNSQEAYKAANFEFGDNVHLILIPTRKK